MPKKNSNGVKNWSLSALQSYEACPAKYKAERIDKVQTDAAGAPAMERGIAIHAKGERYLLGDIPNVPKEFKPFAPELRKLRKLGAAAEQKAAFNRKWEPVDFFDKEAWVRMVLDVSLPLNDAELFMVDFKTGRIYPDKHHDQAHLYATSHLEGYEGVEVEFWYLDQDHIEPYTFNRSCLKEFREYWERRVAPLFSDTKWLTTPSRDACRWCVVKDICPDADT